MNILGILSLIRATGPAIALMASAFAYGAKKYGDGTWREWSVADHLSAALVDMIAWKKGTLDKPVLVDAALHLVFAITVAITNGQQPSEYKK